MIDSIINDYVNNYLGTMELAVKYGVSRTAIQRCLLKANVTLRKRTAKTKVNNFYFSNYNKESCYWAGFILADGYIRSNKRFTLEIKLQKGDYNHLSKFKKAISFEGNILENKLCFAISISSPQIIKDLEDNFGIVTKKSLTCSIINKIPKEYIKDYIRGYFDGDGCITFTSIETITFVGTEKTVDYIRNYFFREVGVRLRSKNIPDISYYSNICSIAYYGKSAIKCLKHMYDDSETYLDRKYKKYQKFSSILPRIE